MIDKFRRRKSPGLFFQLVLFSTLLLPAFPSMAQTGGSPAADVAQLNLGLQGYSIGKKLTRAQKKTAGENPVPKAYAGTYKFVDQDLVVVVEKKTDTVLAMYKRIPRADKKQLKAMVADLMDRFGLPTAMAHEKIVYWAYNRHGAVSEDDFERAKKNKQIPGLGIIATVKLNSEIAITPDKGKDQGNNKASRSSAVQQPETGTVYFIVTSDPLVKAFLANQ
ncbi:MAG TPA: hypothetical protein ENK84_11200 [Desulfobulbus sp.]|nr:hypothetical protein [Desulfobulbus sp.]